MATVAVRGSAVIATNGTTWASTTNAVDGAVGVNNATYATWTNSTNSATAYIELGTFGFSSTIGASDTLNSVTVNVRHFENNTARFTNVQFRPYDGATSIGSVFSCTLATAARNDSTTFSPTLAQLRSSTFLIRINTTHAANTQSAVLSIDYVDVTVDYTPLAPTITQAAYRFYADGTETGATALAAQDTSYAADTSGGDVNMQLRVRLQSTNAGAIGGTDDWQLQYDKNASGTWTNATSASLLTSYPLTNQDTTEPVGFSGVSTIFVESFLGDGLKLARAGFRADNKTGSPTGNLTAVLYAHTGTFGTTGTPTGAVLATSTTTISASSLTTPSWMYFDFDRTYTLTSSTAYFIGVTTDTPSGSNWVNIAGDSVPSYAGNGARWDDSTWQVSTDDLIFEVYTGATTTAVVEYDSANLTNTLLDTYADTNAGATASLFDTQQALAQSFLGTGTALTRAGFHLSKGSTPNGTTSAALWAITGTFGAGTEKPTGSPLATSTTTLTNTALTGSATWTYFDFAGTYTLTNGTAYAIGLTSTISTPSGTGTINASRDSTSPTHAGAGALFPSGAWSNTGAGDIIFEVYASPVTTNRLGAGSGSFVAGRVSETGLVTDLGWTANNYTELLYSITLKQANLANGDALTFRVLRNAATTGMTYTATPTLSITTGGGATAAPAVIARSVTIPAATPQASTTTSPALIARSVVVPAATGQANALPTPAVIARSVTVDAATPLASSTTSPALIARVVTLPATTTTAQSDGTATPAAITSSVTMPAPTAQAGSTAVPAVIARSVTLDAATPQAGSTVTPTVIARAAAVPAVTPQAAATTTPTAIINTATVPAPTTTGGLGATATPAAIARLVTVPAATLQASSSVAPAVTSLTVTIPAASGSGAATGTATPTAITIPATIAAATAKASWTVAPAVISLTVTLPAVTTQAGATVGPAVIPLTVTIPAASASGASTGTATPTVITTTVTMPAPTPKAGTTTTPAATVITVTMPAATPTASRTTSPAVIPLTVAVATVTASGATSGTATPNAVALVTVTPAPTFVYGYRVNPQAIALAVTIAAAVATGLQPDAHPITVTLRDTGHTITATVVGSSATIAATGHTATARSRGQTGTVDADASATVREHS